MDKTHFLNMAFKKSMEDFYDLTEEDKEVFKKVMFDNWEIFEKLGAKLPVVMYNWSPTE